MPHVAVTLEFDKTSKDLALPLDVSVRLVVEGLIEALHLQKTRGKSYRLGIKTEQGLRPISPHTTFAEANILHGMVLMLYLEDQKTIEGVSETGAYLRAENGHTFPLTNKVNIIGRNDAKSGNFVDVDLTALVSDRRVISRRHAQIELEGERFSLIDLGSANGTRLNGQRIAPKEKHPLQEGDRIEFGRNGAKMIFVSGMKK